MLFLTDRFDTAHPGKRAQKHKEKGPSRSSMAGLIRGRDTHLFTRNPFQGPNPSNYKISYQNILHDFAEINETRTPITRFCVKQAQLA